MISAESIKLFRDLCDRSRDIVLTTHINPDGDAIGSEIGIVRWLRTMDKNVRIINRHATPETLRFVTQATQEAEVYEPAEHDGVLRDADLIILVDNSAPDRLGRMEPAMVASAERVLCVDHHPARDAPWAHNIVYVEACATTQIIFDLMQACGFQLDHETAQALYVGLATDTGFFRFNSTTARGHEIASALLGHGVQPARAYEAIYEGNSEAYTRLLGHALSGLELQAGGSVASVQLSHAVIDSLDARDVDTSEMITSLLAMKGVRVAVLYRELTGDRVKVSLRSKGDLDVHGLAVEFGGGGHRNASGIVMEGEMEQAVQVVTQRIESLLQRKTLEA